MQNITIILIRDNTRDVHEAFSVETEAFSIEPEAKTKMH